MTWVRLLLAILAIAVLGQLVVPTLLDARLASDLHRVTGPGSTDQVAVAAVPFWMLAAGRAQDVSATARHATVHFDGYALGLSNVEVNWVDPALEMGPLLNGGRLVPEGGGRLTLTLWVAGSALARFLDESGRVAGADVTVGPHGVTLEGRIQVGGLSGPITTRGVLTIADHQQELLFVPEQLDGFALPVAASVPLLDLTRLSLPLPMRITAVEEKPPYIVIRVASP
jgi:hypothetical protein